MECGILEALDLAPWVPAIAPGRASRSGAQNPRLDLRTWVPAIAPGRASRSGARNPSLDLAAWVPALCRSSTSDGPHRRPVSLTQARTSYARDLRRLNADVAEEMEEYKP